LSQSAARRKFWGWGLEGEGLAASEIERLGAVFTERLGIDGVRVQEPPEVQELDLPAPRVVPPASLEPAFSVDPYDRAAHTYGRSFRDLIRAFQGLRACAGSCGLPWRRGRADVGAGMVQRCWCRGDP